MFNLPANANSPIRKGMDIRRAVTGIFLESKICIWTLMRLLRSVLLGENDNVILYHHADRMRDKERGKGKSGRCTEIELEKPL